MLLLQLAQQRRCCFFFHRSLSVLNRIYCEIWHFICYLFIFCLHIISSSNLFFYFLCISLVEPFFQKHPAKLLSYLVYKYCLSSIMPRLRRCICGCPWSLVISQIYIKGNDDAIGHIHFCHYQTAHMVYTCRVDACKYLNGATHHVSIQFMDLYVNQQNTIKHKYALHISFVY